MDGHKPVVRLWLVSLGFFIMLYFFWAHVKAGKPGSLPDARSRARQIPAPHTDEKLHKFNLTGFDDRGKKFWNLQGDTAKIDSDKVVYLDQNVTLKLRDNTVIKTDHLKWSQDGASLDTDAEVRVNHENTRITGRGAAGRPNEGFVQLNHDIRMVIDEVSGHPTTVTCEGPMKIYYRQNKMIFFRHVKAVDSRGVLTANRMDVLFAPDQKRVSQIVAVGQVVIERAGDITHSHRVLYTLATGSVRLEGNPEITLQKGSAARLDGTSGN